MYNNGFTLKQIYEHRPCSGGRERLELSLGRITPVEYYTDKTIYYIDDLENNTIGDIIWLFERNIIDLKGREEDIRNMVADMAESVLPIFEQARPNDLRPRRAIEACRNMSLSKEELIYKAIDSDKASIASNLHQQFRAAPSIAAEAAHIAAALFSPSSNYIFLLKNMICNIVYDEKGLEQRAIIIKYFGRHPIKSKVWKYIVGSQNQESILFNNDFLKQVNSILEERATTHGESDKQLKIISGLWQAYLSSKFDVSLSSKDVANMMILLKIARASNSDHPDNYHDIAGYAALAFKDIKE